MEAGIGPGQHLGGRLQATGGVRWFDNESKSRIFMDVLVYTSLSAPTLSLIHI